MNPLRKLNRLHLLIGTVLVVLVISVLGVIGYTSWIGISVNLNTINPRDQVGPYETLTFTFSQAVRPNDVENQLQFQPAIDGKLEWQNDRTLRFTPAKPYPRTVAIHLVPGQSGANGDWMRMGVSWMLTIRQPSIVYVNYAEPKDELMVIPADGGAPRQLTSTGSQVLDFDVSQSGETIAYSAINNQQGSDLWLVYRNGQNPRRLLDCGADRCLSVRWSPDGIFIAYNRQLPGATEDDPRLYPCIINVETAQNRPVFSDPQAVGSGALWSPDGNWLASYDLKTAQIHVVNLKSGKEVLLPDNSDQPGSWSPDSASLIYPDYTIAVEPVSLDVNILKNYLSLVDIKTGQAHKVLDKGSDSADYRYGSSLWSPSGDQIALSMRNIRHETPRLWIVRADKPEETIMTAASGYSYDFYQWDMWGIGLVVEQLNLAKANPPEIAVWSAAQGYRVVGKNGGFPHWLP